MELIEYDLPMARVQEDSEAVRLAKSRIVRIIEQVWNHAHPDSVMVHGEPHRPIHPDVLQAFLSRQGEMLKGTRNDPHEHEVETDEAQP